MTVMMGTSTVERGRKLPRFTTRNALMHAYPLVRKAAGSAGFNETAGSTV
ncbi:hypothetical protein [Bosea sp. F3-2]|nr:hypothetical protein [Bosea sp. F3-2]